MKEILAIFPDGDRIKIWLVVGIQSFLSLLDLAGIATIGVLGALAVTGVESHAPGNRVNFALRFLHIQNFQFQTQVALLGILATLLLLFRTFASIFLIKKTLLFISRRGALISSELISNLFSRSMRHIGNYTEQEILFATTSGVQNITLGVIGTGISIISDLSLMVVLAIGLFIVDPTMSISIFVLFGLLGYGLYKYMKSKAYEMGVREVKYGVESNQKIVEFLNTYREAVVKDRRASYVNDISKLRFNLADVLAEKTFMPNISKYLVETTVVLGALVIGGIQFAFQDATHAVASLSVFLAAGTRIAPAILRIQQGSIVIRNSIGSSSTTLEMIRKHSSAVKLDSEYINPDFFYSGFVGEISIKDVTFSYENSEKIVLKDLNLEIRTGEIIALVGPSGAGKSTLVDILLGIYEPNSGGVSISGLSPLEAFKKWPGATSYVPQNIAIIMGTIKDNIALGLNPKNFSDELYWSALERAQLSDFVRSLPGQLNNFVGDQGSQLSGGQRQRLGIARALFTNPKLLVLDEATSSLDVETELAIANVVKSLSGKTTVVTIAHRLSSVRNSDKILYMDSGKIIAEGKFEELRSKVTDFDRQAGIMGL